MLPTRETIETTAEFIARNHLPNLVVDPVIRSTSGYDLIDDAAVRELVRHLLPLARVITPNLAEAERLIGQQVTDLAGMEEAARKIAELCRADGAASAPAVLVKGGHLTATATDLLSITLNPSSFTQSYTSILFQDTKSARLKAGRTYTGVLFSAAPDVQSQAYFIKGGSDSPLAWCDQTGVSTSPGPVLTTISIPTPGAAALLGMAGMMVRRRRA